MHLFFSSLGWNIEILLVLRGVGLDPFSLSLKNDTNGLLHISTPTRTESTPIVLGCSQNLQDGERRQLPSGEAELELQVLKVYMRIFPKHHRREREHRRQAQLSVKPLLSRGERIPNSAVSCSRERERMIVCL